MKQLLLLYVRVKIHLAAAVAAAVDDAAAATAAVEK